MTYASRADMEELWGVDFVADLLPRDIADNPAATATAIANALARAGEEINAHLSARYPLPLPSSPTILVSPCANIAVYILANRHTALTPTIEDRYKHAVRLLERIAEGKAGLGADEPSVSTDPDVSGSGAAFSANGRVFSRDTLP